MRRLSLALMFMANSAFAAEPPPASVWSLDKDGLAEHLQSGLLCPPIVGRYPRTGITVYDGYGLDVSCNYKLAATDITLYLTRRKDGALDDALAEGKRELVQFGAAQHPQLLSETRSTEAGVNWTTTLYAKDDGVHTGIWMADISGWTLEYRASYPAVDDARILADLKTFTAVAGKAAAKRLAVCAKTAEPKRGATLVTDKKDLEQSAIMTSLLAGAALSVVQDGKAKTEPQPTWCVERPLQAGDHNFLFWRGVDADGGDTRADRITPMSIGVTPALTAAPDSMAGLLEGLTKGGEKPLHWVVTLPEGRQTLIFGYFDGRPSPEALVDLFGKIMVGRAKPLGGYGVNGKAITITMPPDP